MQYMLRFIQVQKFSTFVMITFIYEHNRCDGEFWASWYYVVLC